MDLSLTGRLYRRYRLRYTAGMFVWIAAMFFVVELVALWLFKHYEAASAEAFWVSVGVASAAGAVGFAWSMWRTLRVEELLIAWIRNGPTSEHAGETWVKAVSAPRRLVRRYIGRIFPLWLAAAVGILSALVDSSPAGIVFAAVGTVLATLWLVPWLLLD